MKFLKNPFRHRESTEAERLDYAVSQITPSTLISHEKFDDAIRNRYPTLTIEEIKKIESGALDIFSYCEKIPASDENFDKRVKKQYPFLSREALVALRGAVTYSQIK